MRVLLVHPSALMYSEIYLRLEPLGLECVATAIREAGHDVRLLDLQVFTHRDYWRELEAFRPEAVGFSVNYLANVPEVIDLAVATRRRRPGCFLFAGGHSLSFIAAEVVEHAQGALDCVVRGEGELIAPRLLEAIGDARLSTLPGVVTADGAGPSPLMHDDLDRFPPARDLARRRRKYFIGVLDPCASAEFSRGCPWDCSFCSAWTFYGRSYRKASPEAAAADIARIAEPNVFLVDDVAFVHPEHGLAVDIIADPSWDERQFAIVRDWALTVPEIVHFTVATPYPGTEIWHTESRRLTTLDYRLFDVQHAVLPTRLPLAGFYEELVRTQSVLNRKHLGVAALRATAAIAARLALRGQTNFLRMLWKFNSVYSRDRQFNDHARPVKYAMRPPAAVGVERPRARDLFIHLGVPGGHAESATRPQG